ncbi:hypothetical protein [Bacillus sp. AG4(2022)]|nr:hypothetical protein [Bacillus sp. AG4(2022)]MDT0163853.1 hypothetical protein [Bacillus sp. AG4(2022)]
MTPVVWYLLSLLIVFLGIMVGGFIRESSKGGVELEDQRKELARNEWS